MAFPHSGLPSRPVERLFAPVQRFLHIQAASGIVLLVCTAVALVLANSPFADTYAAFWKTPIVLSIGGFKLADTLGHLVVNDGLMTIFFFVVGLEIKREVVDGELADPRKALLPIFAALGGMVMPALVFLAFQWNSPGQRGWAIPMATDIAFVVGFLALFGSRVPFSLKIFLLSLAIVDDLGAVFIIALVYTEGLAWGWLSAAAAGFGLTYLFNRLGVRQVGTYVFVGIFIWVAFLKAGIHPTVAGVMLGLLTPATAWIGDKTFVEVLSHTWQQVIGDEPVPTGSVDKLLPLQVVARETISPLARLESALHPWVAFVIMPIFALANAGVPLKFDGLQDPVALAVAAGLLIGKPLGILGACALAIGLRITTLPSNVTWRMLAGGACLAGIGFTMALFLNALAFPEEDYAVQAAAGKIGTLAGSVVSAILGAAILLVTLPKANAAKVA